MKPVMAGITRQYMKTILLALLTFISANSFSQEFEEFFSVYKEDACFAKERTAYPVKMITYIRKIDDDRNEVSMENIRYIESPNSATCGIDLQSYSKQMNLVISTPRYENNSAVVRLYTVDSGFDWDYVFKRHSGEWKFSEMVSHSF
jgi:hypothetical protein